MIPRDKYAEAVATMRTFGEVKERDFFPSAEAPYRYALLRLPLQTEDVGAVIASLLSAVRPFGCHVSVWTHFHDATYVIESSVTRRLDDDEIGEEPPFASREVGVAALKREGE